MSSDDWFIGGCIAAIFALLVLLAVVVVGDAKQWAAYKTAHNCKVVAHITGDVFNTVGIGGDGKMSVGIGSTPDKTGWLCDDGVTYYR